MTTTATPETPPRARIDPRFRQRRIAVRRDEGRRRLKLLVAAVCLVAFVALGFGLTRSPVLDVDHIRLVGATNTQLSDVVHLDGLRRRQAMFDLDEAGLARRTAALPWVATAKVTRHWPGTVVITVTERVAIAALPRPDGGWALTDRTGRVLATVLVAPPDIPTLTGLPQPGPPGSRLADTAGPVLTAAVALPPSLLAQVAAVEPDGAPDAVAGDVALMLRSGAFVRIGDVDGLRAKLDAVATVLAQADLAHLSVLDVRVPGSPVIRRS